MIYFTDSKIECNLSLLTVQSFATGRIADAFGECRRTAETKHVFLYIQYLNILRS